MNIGQRFVAGSFDPLKFVRVFREAYRRAPHYAETMPLVQRIAYFENPNLFAFVAHSISLLRDYLELPAQLIISSPVHIDHSLKAQDKVLALCEAFGADTYVNAPGGVSLYDRDMFAARGIDLKFVRPLPFEYPQFSGGAFVPWLSIIDMLMHCPLERAQDVVRNQYEEF